MNIDVTRYVEQSNHAQSINVILFVAHSTGGKISLRRHIYVFRCVINLSIVDSIIATKYATLENVNRAVLLFVNRLLVDVDIRSFNPLSHVVLQCQFVTIYATNHSLIVSINVYPLVTPDYAAHVLFLYLRCAREVIAHFLPFHVMLNQFHVVVNAVKNSDAAVINVLALVTQDRV
jgi:hypothetical protein